MRTLFILVIALLFASSVQAQSHCSTSWSIASTGSYVLQSQLPPSPTGTGEFGAATALWHDPVSGTDWAAVGAPLENLGAGAVYIYCHETGASAWGLITEIAAPDSTPRSEFGAAVALDADTLVVGAPMHVNDFTIGAAYVFVRDVTTGAWVQQGDEINARIGAFGSAVAVRGDQMAIGDPVQNRVYPFSRSGGVWSALTPIEAPAETFFPSFGASLWMSETELLVGAPTDNHTRVDQGSCSLYALSRGSWDLQQILRPTIDTSSEQFFCQSVAKSDRGILVGSPRANNASGAINVFSFDAASGAWKHQAKIPEPAGDTTAPPLPLFGTSIASDGDTLVAGTPGRDRAMVFRFHGGVWTHDSTLMGDDGSLFGASVATAASTLLVGAIKGGDTTDGAAYTFINDRIFADGFGN